MNAKWIWVACTTALVLLAQGQAEARMYSYVGSPQSAAVLVANDPQARINLRAAPRKDAPILGYGLVGDPVHLITYMSPEGDRLSASDDQGWYFVKFDRSGAEGWIRADFVDNFAE
ncbi:MAG TPA: SH3 domain-containing protein [Stenomitos sp.]